MKKDKELSFIAHLTFGVIILQAVWIFLLIQRIDVLMDKFEILEQREALIEQIFLNDK